MNQVDSLDLSFIDNLPTQEVHSYKCLYEERLATKPSYCEIEDFKRNHDSLDCGASYIRKDGIARDKHDLNWCSVDDFTDNWKLLSNDDRNTLRSLIKSEFKTNACRYGLKRKNLETHLLLNLGCDMTNIVDNKADGVLSNLKMNGYYTRSCLANRTVDPRTSLRYIWKFNKSYSVETLFVKKFVCFTCVISSDDSYRKIDDMEKSKTSYHDFFRQNVDYVRNLSKKGKVLSYIYSNEISVDSILDQQYRPHTHFMLFVQRNALNQELMLNIEKDFNLRFSDRNMNFMKSYIDHQMLPTEIKKAKDGRKLSDYMFKTYSLAPQYMREIRETNVRELNLKTVETYRNLIWLYRGEDANRKKGVRRNQHSHIPSVDQMFSFKHPLLQNKTKYPTIKKSSPNTGKNETTETRPSKPLSDSGISKAGRTDGREQNRSVRAAEDQRMQRRQMLKASINDGRRHSIQPGNGQRKLQQTNDTHETGNTSTGKICPLVTGRECANAAKDQTDAANTKARGPAASHDSGRKGGHDVGRKTSLSSRGRRSIFRERISTCRSNSSKRSLCGKKNSDAIHTTEFQSATTDSPDCRQASSTSTAGSTAAAGTRKQRSISETQRLAASSDGAAPGQYRLGNSTGSSNDPGVYANKSSAAKIQSGKLSWLRQKRAVQTCKPPQAGC